MMNEPIVCPVCSDCRTCFLEIHTRVACDIQHSSCTKYNANEHWFNCPHRFYFSLLIHFPSVHYIKIHRKRNFEIGFWETKLEISSLSLYFPLCRSWIGTDLRHRWPSHESFTAFCVETKTEEVDELTNWVISCTCRIPASPLRWLRRGFIFVY